MKNSTWESVYSAGGHNNSWPWSDLISLWHRYRNQIDNSEFSVLDLGSGTGNNYPFWKSLESNYYGIEISETAIDIFLRKFPEVNDQIFCGDFSLMKSLPIKFDVICDRGSVTCGDMVQVNETIKLVSESLKEGGLYIGVDWYSKSSTDFTSSSAVVDENSRTNFKKGPLVGIGTIHFADEDDMLRIFSEFEVLELSEKVISWSLPESKFDEVFASWNIVVRKKQ
jgi:SAM-dependent methyltransferase